MPTQAPSSFNATRRSVLCLAAASPWGWATAQPTPAASTEVLRVGPQHALKTLAEAARQAKAGAVIEVQAGEYAGDVAVWAQEQITLRAVGGRVRLVAAGASAEGKAIWVVRGGRMEAEGFDFSGARVAGRNGAGIRFEKGSLRVRNCTFMDNENGILTGNNNQAELEIENSEFGRNGAGDGQSHNLYVGEIARLTVRGSYLHHANVGHLLKSRAAINDIRYNRLTDEAEGRASYELEFPAGGKASVVGNIIQQGPNTQNSNIISFGAEGYKWPDSALYLVHNTIVNQRAQGATFLRLRPGGTPVVYAVNNLLVGGGGLEAAGSGDYQANFTVGSNVFEDFAAYDLRLKRNAGFAGKAVEPGDAALRLDAQYQHPRSTRALQGAARVPGAIQR